MASSGGIEPFDADQMIESDMDSHHLQASLPVAALATMADSLPGLGIVAAVLGVVITMGSLGGPPEEIGQKVAAALVGTFLGILLCYGLVGPIASNMAKTADEEHAYYQVLRVLIVAFMKGTAPSLAIEIGRRSIPGNVRPPFQETENYIKGKTEAPAEGAAPESAPLPRRKPRLNGKRSIQWLQKLPSSSSRKRRLMAAIMAAHGKWPMPISSRP